MNEAQRQLLEQFKQENQATVASIYDEDEDDSEQGGLNREQKQLFNQFIEQREGQKRRVQIESNTPTGLIDTTYNTFRRGLSRLANIPNVMMTEQFSELASAQRKKEEEDARLAAEGKERPWWYKILSWQREGAKNTADELDALAADKAKDVIERELYTQENFPMSESARKQLEKITSTDKFFGQEGAIIQALSDPLATASGALQVAGEQIPTLAAVLVAARKSPKLAASVMGSSTFLQERFGQLVSEAQEAGYDLSNPEQALAAVKDKDFMAAQADKGFTRGSIIAATDLIFLGLASRAKFNLKGIGTQTGVQALGGGTGEFLAQVASGDEISPGDILIESLAEGVSAPVDVAAFGLKKASETLNSETRLDAKTAQALADDEAELEKAKKDEAEKEKIILEQQQKEQGKIRLQAAPSFIPRDQFLKAREEKRKADALNPNTETGQAYENYKLTAQIYPASEKEENATLAKFLKAHVGKDDREIGIQQYNAALDAHAAGIADGTINPVLNDAKKTKTDTKIKTKTETPVVKTTEEKPPKPEGKVVAAQRAYAEEQLGENWETFGGLSQAFDNRTGFYKKLASGKTVFQGKVDAEVAARDEAAKPKEEVLDPKDTAGDTAVAVNPTQVSTISQTLGRLNLSPSEAKIADTLLEATRDGTLDTLIDSKGKPIHKALRKRAGLNSKQANNTALNRLMEKIAKSFGTTKEDFKERLRQTRTVDFQGNVRAEDTGPETFNEASEQLDVADLGTGLGTIGGVGGSQVEDAGTSKKAKAKARQIEGYKKLGLTDEQIDQLFVTQEDSSNQIEQENFEKAEKAALKNLQQVPVEAVKDAATRWNQNKAPETKPFGSLSPVDQQEWILGVQDFFESKQDNAAADELTKVLRDIEAQERAQIETAIKEQPNENDEDANQGGPDQVGSTTGQDRNEDGQGATTQSDTEPTSRETDSKTKEKASETIKDLSEEEGTFSNLLKKVEESEKAKNKVDSKDPKFGINDEQLVYNKKGQIVTAQDLIDDPDNNKLDELFDEDGNKLSSAIAKARIESYKGKLLSQAAMSDTWEKINGPEYYKAQSNERKLVNFKQVIQQLTGKEDSWRVKIYNTIADAAAARIAGQIPGGIPDASYAFTIADEFGSPTTHIILDRVKEGNEKAIFLHEVGGHIGLDNIIPKSVVAEIANTIRIWNSKNNNSIETIVAKRALSRIHNATGAIIQKQRDEGVPEAKIKDPFSNVEYANSELVAYFLEEATIAGVEPSVKTPIGRLVRKLYAFFKKALRKADFNPDSLTATDIVDLGWGAARFSLSTRKHGTAATFHKFDRRMVGTGEGNQAYGWGWYLAERFGIARHYLRSDERRKQEMKKYDYDQPRIPLSSLSPELEARVRNPTIIDGIDTSRSVFRRNSILTDAKEIDKAGKPQPYLTYDPDKRDFIVNYPSKNYDSMLSKTLNGNTVYLSDFMKEPFILPMTSITFDEDGNAIEKPEKTTRDFAGELPLINDKTRLDFDNQFGALVKQSINDFRAWEVANKVEGSFMHVDTIVQDDELLPWNEDISTKPKVRDAIVSKFNEMLTNEDPRTYLILDTLINRMYFQGLGRVNESTNAALARIEKDLKDLRWGKHWAKQKAEGAVDDNWLKAKNTVVGTLREDGSQTPTAKEYSEIFFGEGRITEDVISDILNKASGVAIYDALYSYQFENQQDSLEYREDTLLHEDLTDDQRILSMNPADGKFRADVVASLWLDNIGVKGVQYPDAGTMGNFDQGAEGMSNNVVVFNDDNLFIVGRTPGKQVQNKQNAVNEIKFGISEDWVESTNGGEKARQAWGNAKEIARTAAESVEFLHQVIRRVKEKVPSLGKWYEAVLKSEATRTEIRKSFESIALRARDLKPDRLEILNDFIGKSTFFQKWGYDPEIEGKEVTVDPIMERAFNRLTSAEKQIVKDVFLHGERMRKRKIDIAKEFGVEGKFFTDSALQGPYAPLKRFGTYVTVLKSEEMYQAELARNAEGATKEDRKRYDELSQDPNHYVVSFFDTKPAGENFAKANASKFKYRSTTKKIPDVEADRISNPQVFEKVLGALNAGEDSNIDNQTKQYFSKMVKDLYFQSLDERNAKLSGAKRLNRAGYDKNMMRSFISHAKAEAALIAQMENGAAINTALQEAAKETKGEGNVRDDEKNQAFVLVTQHYKEMLKGDETPIQDRLAAANSVYMLLTSVGYHVANSTQPTMVTVPRVAGDFNDYTGAWAGLTKGYKLSMDLVSMSAAMETNVNVDKAPLEYRSLLKRMELAQLLDVGMEEDLSSFESFDTGFDKLNFAMDTTGKITHKLYQVSRLVEAVNRISAAVSAYDMARKNPAVVRNMKMTAEEYAVAVVEDTQGNFSKLDAPRLLKALNSKGGKIMTQYRKYQLLMAWHYSSAFKQMFRGETPESRAAGKRILMYSLAHAGIFAGTVGMPMVSTIFWALSFLGDEDEPADLERWIYKNIDDGMFGRFLSRGVFGFVGIDLSSKLDQSKIFAPLPYVDFQTGEAGYKEIIGGMVGPAGTTASNFFRAHEYYTKGDLMKAIEYSVPKGVRTALESYRLGTEGYTMKNGDVVVDPREISGLALFFNSLGIPSSQIQNIKWTRGQQFVLEQYFSKESGRLRKEYIKANKNRDRDTQRRLREEWKDLQKAKDRVRYFFNDAPGVLNKQPVSDLIKAPRQQRKRERKAQVRFGN